MPARSLLKFSTPRKPAQLAAFINLRVLNPEHAHWRRGIEAAVIYNRLHGDLKVPFTYRVPGGQDQAVEAEGRPASLANIPLGQWIADNRRFYARGDMDEARVEQLEKLGMVWSHFDVAWEEGLAAARGWAAEAGHLLAPLNATFQGYKVGIWLKNVRAAARKAQEIEQRRAEGLPGKSSAGALSDERREQLEDIDPPGARAGRWNGSAASTSSGSTWRPATRCPPSPTTSCTRARTSGGGYAPSGSAGTT
ncbi:helicase associated domain-containing protein [Streptomyces sennicomposti]